MLELQDYVGASDYLLAWSLYLVSALVIFFMLWRLTRRWQRDTRFLLLALLAVVLLTPAPVPGRDVLAPAIIFVALGGVTGGAEVVAPVLVRLSLIGLLAVILVTAEGVWWRRRRRRQ
jgi:hypothetical protein